MNSRGCAEAGVRKRCFVHLAGYEPVGADQSYRRFIREMARFKDTWNVQGSVSLPRYSPDQCMVSWTVHTWGPNWRLDTEFHNLLWDDFVTADMQVSDWRRIPLGVAAMMDFILSGTASKYLVAAWRYFLFFLYPLGAFTAIVSLAILLAWSVTARGGLPHHSASVTVLSLAVLILLWRLLREKLQLRHALDNWCFARDFVYRGRPQFEERLNRFAQELLRLVSETEADEIVVFGHSLGVPISLIVIDRALKFGAEFSGRSKPIHLVSSGSSLLKVALHPAAGWLREVAYRVANVPGVYWVEFQALSDPLGFYKVDPMIALDMAHTGKPIVKIIRLSRMLKKATYRRLKLNFSRMHRQTMMGNELRYAYDYYMLSCGPIGLPYWVENFDRIIAAFGNDGALVMCSSVAAAQSAREVEVAP
jgi:pimeloyl-ACP methyl ester carboxylesterase